LLLARGQYTSRRLCGKLNQLARIGNFRVHVVCRIPHTENQKEGLMRSVHDCLIHYSLLAPPEIEIEFAIAEAAVPHS